MSVKTRNFTLVSSALAALVLLAATFFACESTLGFGDPIDWEAPVLQFRPVPDSPMHVRGGAKLTGTVTDNVGVTRVIARDANTGKEMDLFQVTLTGDNPKVRTWEIVMNFSAADNGKQIPLEIVAYDKAENSGASSMVAVTIKVDIRPPVVRDMQIYRTATKTADLEAFSALYALEKGEVTPANPNGLGSDPDGEISANANRYQNGVFTFSGKVAETETSIEIISLNIYDVDRATFTQTLLLEKSEEADYPSDFSPFSPQWQVSEVELLNAGEAKKAGYKSAYYTNHTRYYYRVEIVARDNSKNESNDDDNTIKEDEGFFVMWEKADEPKGVIDPLVIPNNPGGISIQKGSQLPVVFFDDDQLDWAYTGFLTEDQWNGTANLNPGGLRMSGSQAAAAAATDTEKLAWLKTQLQPPTSATINNWKQHRYPGTGEQIVEQISGKSLDEHIFYVQVGNSANDNGEYRLFTLVADKKLDPHPPIPASTDPITYQTREIHRVYKVNVIDENEPLIYFDTSDPSVTSGHLGSPPHENIVGAQTGNSPEENTFPKLNSDGKTFTINGYTLRDNKQGQNNRVVKFRMAWIPNAIADDARIRAVKAALQADDYQPPSTPPSGSMAGQYAAGVRHWNFALRDERHPDNYPNNTTYEPYTLLTGTRQTLVPVTDPNYDGSFLKKQVFKKTFDLLEDFKYNNALENDTKLFIFFAEDDMGHGVFRELRLLGKKTPPDIAIYDISGRINDALMPLSNTPTPPTGALPTPYIPNVGASPSLGDAENSTYITALNTYNKRPDVYTLLKNNKDTPAALTDADRTIPFQIYTRGTILKYWVSAAKNGDINIKSIKMQDITAPKPNTEPREVGSAYNTTDGALTYTEYFPDEAQRVFLFTATDSLGNVAQVQRTVAITNTARLDSITTTSGSGTYGIGKTITLKANFSGQIKITGTPRLNVRYTLNGATTIQSITCQPVSTSTLALEFIFTVPEGASGQLLTMYDGDNLGGNADETVATDRPISLLGGARIIDNIRDVDAFVPGYKTGSTSMPKWTTNKNSLQETKTIMLDGTRPVITSIAPGGKTPYSTGQYYFKTNETIQLTLSTATANGKNIRASTSTPPRLQYYIRENPPTGTLRGPYNAAFTYLRPSGSKALVFGLEVNSTNCPYDGELVNVTLYGAGTIEDDAENSIVASTVETLWTARNFNIYIKKTAPVAPASTLTATGVANVTFPPSGSSQSYNVVPTLTIAPSAAVLSAWENVIQYSLNGGLEWTNYTTGVSIPGATDGTAKTYDLRTRYVDRAGNDGTEAQKTVSVKDNFPKLIAVTPVQSNGWYRSGTLEFNLNFADRVRAAAAGNTISITLRNRAAANNSDAVTTSSAVTITYSPSSTTLASTITVSFNVSGKEMRDGLYVSAVDFSNLRDEYGNVGGTYGTAATGNWPTNGSTAPTITPNGSTCPNLAAGLRVDSIVPTVTGRTPASGGSGVSEYPTSTTDKRNVITLTFSEPVVKGNGTITIKPEKDSLIPPVFEDNGYYLNQFGGTNNNTEVKPNPNVKSNLTTWIPGFYDVYNNAALVAADRNALTQSTTTGSRDLNPATAGNIPSSAVDNTTPSMTRLVMDQRTGQPVGPYVKTTQGLIEGAGITGNYSGTNYNTGPNPTAGRMVPDTATKWVLAYRYGIHNTAATHESYSTPANANTTTLTTPDLTTVPAIQAVLKKAKFRWQEIDVISSNVVISNNGLGTTVTITLDEPLLKGLKWELSYPAGTFTDEAGNPAAAQAEDNYIFWSAGVSKPVIRVDRRSYDARTANWKQPVTANNTVSYTYAEPPDGSGWGLGSFNTIAYRIESETPGATISWGLNTRVNSTDGTTGNVAANAVTGAWTGTVANVSETGYTSVGWDNISSGTNNVNQWVRPNLINRGGSGNGGNTYTVNGITRSSTGNLRLLRSYNEDPTPTTLSGLSLTAGTAGQGWYKGAVTFTALEAGKRYVAATAQRTGQTDSNRGYEGVFRTVILLSELPGGGQEGGRNKVAVQGSNIKNGMPSIAGFPVQDAAETADSRFIKLMNNNGGQTQFTWVSTEIVSEWYFLYFGNGGSHMSAGEVNNYLTVSYGDLTYGRNISHN